MRRKNDTTKVCTCSGVTSLAELFDAMDNLGIRKKGSMFEVF
jgi:hypothetical protein